MATSGQILCNLLPWFLVLDGVYRLHREGRLRFVPVPAPSTEELKRLVRRIAERTGRSLERSGLITRDIENAYLAFDPSEEAPIYWLIGHSITDRIATGPRQGQKVFTLQTLPASPRPRARPRRPPAMNASFVRPAGLAASHKAVQSHYPQQATHGITVSELWRIVFGRGDRAEDAGRCLEVMPYPNEGWRRRLRRRHSRLSSQISLT